MPRPSIIGGQGIQLVPVASRGKKIQTINISEELDLDTEIDTSEQDDKGSSNSCCPCWKRGGHKVQLIDNSHSSDAELHLAQIAKNGEINNKSDREAKETEWDSHLKIPGRKRVRKTYESFLIQVSVAGLIFLNFVIACFDAQTKSTRPVNKKDFFGIMEAFFAYIFLIELLVNMYGSWFRRFWRNAWNWFDFIIVIISLMSLYMNDLPGISVLRLFRAFRVFRLFKRIPSLRIIIEGIGASIVGVSNAFMILTILMGIWAIIGVEFFHSRDHGEREDGEYFGNFLRAMYTLFQVMTMDSWCSNIARSITYGDEGNPLNYTRGVNGFENLPSWVQFPLGMYFISWIMIGGIVMMNVVVAVLLERYLEATKQEEAKIKEENMIQCFTNKSEWKKIPHAMRKNYQFHPPAHEKDRFKSIFDDDFRRKTEKKKITDEQKKKIILTNLKIAKTYELWNDIAEVELRHLVAILWQQNYKTKFMAKVIEKHKHEHWVTEANEPSFLLKTLLKSRGDENDADSDDDSDSDEDDS